ncbi:MAG: hypothetical protein HRU03_08105 [Nanoarchaeales archaeon]|nr:hypothetical protein [Nanoarchaeales archaeon]
MDTATNEKNILIIDLTPKSVNIKNQEITLRKIIYMESIDGVILGAGSHPDELNDELDKLDELDIPIFAVDTKIEYFGVYSYISVDNYDSVGLAEKHIVDVTKSKGTVLIIIGTYGQINSVDSNY